MKEDIKQVGDWLYGLLSPIELKKIIEHESRAIGRSNTVVLDIQISLFELEVLRLGHIPDKRNCFELYPRTVRSALEFDSKELSRLTSRTKTILLKHKSEILRTLGGKG